jgi:RNA polymerase sigma-54 factor
MQTMSLMPLTALELYQHIEAELAANPALELVMERRCPVCGRLLPERGHCPVCTRPISADGSEPIVFVSPRTDFVGGMGKGKQEEEEDEDAERFLRQSENLAEYVLQQITSELGVEDRRLAVYWLSHLNEDGLVDISVEEVAWYHHVSTERVRNVQRLIQRCEPFGVGSCTPREALLVQLEILDDGGEVIQLARRMIADGWEWLGKRQYGELARLFNCSVSDVEAAVSYIAQNLNPFPGRGHWGQESEGHRSKHAYYVPDIIFSTMELNEQTQIVVEIIQPLAGTLRVNPLYQRITREAQGEQREELRADLERAALLVKCLKQRNHTLQRMMRLLTVTQRDFILGDERSLKSLTRAELAQQLGLHESTISRSVANKVVQLPNGRMMPLANFFVRNLSVRSVLRDLVTNETRPLSDTELMKALAEQGFFVARRTVAKYRALEGILPSGLRHSTRKRAV